MARQLERISRRDVLRASGAAGAVGLTTIAGCTGDQDQPLGNYPVDGDTVGYGFNGPLSGILAADGEQQRDGFELAIEHLNNGGGLVDHIDELSGEGVLEYEVEGYTGDTEGDEDVAADTLDRMIDRDEIMFFTGGISSSVEVTSIPIAADNHVIHGAVFSHTGEITGEDCGPYTFRSAMSARTSAEALAQVLPNLFGEDQEFFQIYLDYAYGQSNRDHMQALMEEQGWTEVGTSAIAYGETDHETQIDELASEEPDVLVFTSMGDAMASGLSQLADRGFEDLDVAVPLLSAFSMEPAGEAAEGVVGTANWHPAGGTDWSDDFTDAFEDEYGYTPGQAAMEVYDACLHYSAAVEETGSFHPTDVADTLETFDWEYAMGEMAYRECDHQATRPAYVVEGVDEETYEETGIWLDLVEEIPGSETEYSCDDEPAANCEMPEREE